MEPMKEIDYSSATDWARYVLITAFWATLKLSGVWQGVTKSAPLERDSSSGAVVNDRG